MSEKSVAELASELKVDFDKKFDAVKELAEKALHATTTLTESEKEKTDAALLDMNAVKAQIKEIEQKLARDPGNDDDKKEKSFGERFTESERFKDLLSRGGRGKADMTFEGESLHEKATLNSATTASAGSVGDAIRNSRLPGILPQAQRRLTVRDLLLPGRMDGSTLEYVKETGWTNAAAPVAEAAAKPGSDIQFDLISTSARVIAHWMKASRQVLDDISQLRSIIDQRLMYGLKLVEENQLLNGAGTGQNLSGLVTNATAYAAPITISSPTSIDMLRLAALQASLTEFPASGIVLHPSDWAWVELLKDTTGRYIIGNPQGVLRPTLWNLPVVATQAMTIDKFLVAAFENAQIFDRWTARIEVATENEDDFIKNLVTILCEERLALAIYRPESFIYGDFGRVA